MNTETEVVEQEMDADSLRPHMVSYLQTLVAAAEENKDDVDELGRIITRVMADKNCLENLANRMTERKTHLANMKTKTLEIGDLMNRAIAERNQ